MTMSLGTRPRSPSPTDAIGGDRRHEGDEQQQEAGLRARRRSGEGAHGVPPFTLILLRVALGLFGLLQVIRHRCDQVDTLGTVLHRDAVVEALVGPEVPDLVGSDILVDLDGVTEVVAEDRDGDPLEHRDAPVGRTDVPLPVRPPSDAEEHDQRDQQGEAGAETPAPNRARRGCGDPSAGPSGSLVAFADRRQHDDRDVVDPAGPVRRFHEPVRGLLWLLAVLQDRLDLILGHHPRESVAAEQQLVAVEQRDHVLVDLDLLIGSERACEDVLVRVHVGFRLGDLAGLHHPRHERVIGRELAELPLAEQVGARVPDVGDQGARAVDQGRRERRAHTGETLVLDRAVPDRAIRAPDMVRECASAAGGELLDRLERESRGDVSTPVSAHAVGHDEQGRLDQYRVIVLLADTADVQRGPHLDPHGGGSFPVPMEDGDRD